VIAEDELANLLSAPPVNDDLLGALDVDLRYRLSGGEARPEPVRVEVRAVEQPPKPDRMEPRVNEGPSAGGARETPPEQPSSTPNRVLRLLIASGGRSAERVVVAETLIGRSDPTRDIHPDIALTTDMLVSRRHARIFERGGQFYLSDLGSANGTMYNKALLQPQVDTPLKAGDLVELGESSSIRVIEAP
jgi:hypothetical protein